eukprot:jgi/Undpi1/10988/HiC_scaffold_30.g13289.m1
MWKGACAFAFILLVSPVGSFSLAGHLRPSSKAARTRATRDVSVKIEKSETESEVQPPAAGSGGGSSGGQSTSELVTDLLARIEGTNRGVDCTAEQRQGIDGIIKQASGRSFCMLNAAGEGKNWLTDPQIFGNYNVAYVSSGSSEKSNPAGGRWRGRLGRTLFRTEEMFQHLVAPATAVNMIVFRAFGLLYGCVTLRGDFEAMPERPNFVRASFGPPLLNILGRRGLTVRAGPQSSVALAATYVDDRIRLGEGGRGSLFVFTRGGPAATPAADMWKVYASKAARPVKATLLGGAVAVGAVAAAVRSAFLPAGLLALLSVSLIVTQGGVIVDPNPDGVETKGKGVEGPTDRPTDDAAECPRKDGGGVNPPL